MRKGHCYLADPVIGGNSGMLNRFGGFAAPKELDC
jgi:hypothetical protein